MLVGPGPLNLGRFLSLIEHVGYEKRYFQVSLLQYSGSNIFSKEANFSCDVYYFSMMYFFQTVHEINRLINNNCQWVLCIVLVARARSLVPQFTVIELWCITNRYIGFESVDSGSTGVWRDFLSFSVKVISNYSNAI